MRRGTALVPSADGSHHETADVVHLETSEDILALRDDVAFHGGRMTALTFPSAAKGFIRNDAPTRSLGDIRPGAYIFKTAEGRFGFLRDYNAFQENA